MRVFCTKNGRHPAIDIVNGVVAAFIYCMYCFLNQPQWK